jgi:hypothetical protein
MPLIKSKSKKARNRNIRELIHTYKQKGKIGKTKPRSLKHAIAIASAIAYDIQRKSKHKRKTR